jgi:hypothetical protein
MHLVSAAASPPPPMFVLVYDEPYERLQWKSRRFILLAVSVFFFVTTFSSRSWSMPALPLHIWQVLPIVQAMVWNKHLRFLARLQAAVSPFLVSWALYKDQGSECGSVGALSEEMCIALRTHGQLPLFWFVFPTSSILLGYCLVVPFILALPSRLCQTVVCTYLIYTHSPPYHNYALLALAHHILELAATYVAEQETLSEYSKRNTFDRGAEREKQAVEGRQSTQAASDASTLIKNAMRISFPNNALHPAEMEERLERVLGKLPGPVAQNMVEVGESIKPDARPIPMSASLAVKNVRALRVSAGSLHGSLCVIKTLVDAEALEDEDLETLTHTVALATALPRIPGLLQTLGCCWSPVIMIAEQVSSFVTFRDLAIALRARQILLDWELFRPLAMELAQSIAALHARGVLHREVFIGTIALTSQTSCALPPIGFLHAIPEARRKVLGHSVPLAPETKDAADSFSAACDVWSLGVVCWEMLVGTFSEVSPIAMPTTIPKSVQDVILDAISSDPESRPSAAEMLAVFSLPVVTQRMSFASFATFAECAARIGQACDLQPPTTNPGNSSKPAAESKSKEDGGGGGRFGDGMLSRFAEGGSLMGLAVEEPISPSSSSSQTRLEQGANPSAPHPASAARAGQRRASS